MAKEITHKDLAPHIYSLRFWIKNIEPDSLKELFNSLLGRTRYNVLNFSEHFFPVQGYTAIWLLAESHLAVHTFPGDGWAYVELSGCNQAKTDNFKLFIAETDHELKWETLTPSQSFPNKSIETNKI